MPSLKKCHFCGELFEKSKPEHVFPFAIGGNYKIKGVCSPCNEKLGKLIDQPFSMHPMISTYRLEFDLKNGPRDQIRDPLYGMQIDDGENSYTLRYHKGGYVESTLIARLKEVVPGKQVQLTIDKKRIERDLPAIKKKLAKKYNIPEEAITIGEDRENIPRAEKQIQIIVDNDTILLGFLKIMFESAAELIPGYSESGMAKEYARMLLSAKLDVKLKKNINPNYEIVRTLLENFQYSLNKRITDHALLLTGYEGVGLVGLIKIFGEFHVLILSDDKRFESQEMILLFNDFITKKVRIYSPDKISKGNVTLVRDETIVHSLIEEEFLKSGKNAPLLSRDGKIMYNTIFDIAQDKYFKKLFDFLEDDIFTTTHFIDGNLFFHSILHKKLCPISSVVLTHQMKKIN